MKPVAKPRDAAVALVTDRLERAPLEAAHSDARALSPAAKGEPLYGLIELMFFAYRDFVEDADRVLAGDGFGRAHHRVLYFVARRPGLTIAELLEILKITKQSLNRVLKDLVDRGYVTNRLCASDRRQRRLSATPRGDALVSEIAGIQSARFTRAFRRLDAAAASRAASFLAAMMDPSDREFKGAVPSLFAASDTATT